MTELIRVEDIHNPTWMVNAKCSSYPPNWFIAEGKKNNHDAKNAKAVCNTCPVKQDCLDWAVKMEAEDKSMPGIYGGTTQQERRDLRICIYQYCDKPVKNINTKSRSQNNFCSKEHQDEQAKLRVKKAREKELNKNTEYYMRGILHHG